MDVMVFQYPIRVTTGMIMNHIVDYLNQLQNVFIKCFNESVQSHLMLC